MTPQDARRPAGKAPRVARLHLFLCLAALCVAGCAPKDPLESKVEANDELSFSMWRSKAERALTPQQILDFDKATQEIRFHIMSTGAASGSEAVGEALRTEINGQTVRHVLLEGLGLDLQRSEAERASLETSMKANAQMRTRPGDTDSAHYLSDLHDRQAARLQAATEEVRHAKERLAAAEAPAKP